MKKVNLRCLFKMKSEEYNILRGIIITTKKKKTISEKLHEFFDRFTCIWHIIFLSRFVQSALSISVQLLVQLPFWRFNLRFNDVYTGNALL